MKLNLTLLVITLSLMGLSTLAQQRAASDVRPVTAVVVGTVYDSNHAVVVGALVVARDVSRKDFTAVTDSDGIYHFELPHGVYRVEASAEGFCPKRIENFRSFLGQLDFTLVMKPSGGRCKQDTMITKPSLDPLEQERLRRIAE